jgi:hypothetical protein
VFPHAEGLTAQQMQQIARRLRPDLLAQLDETPTARFAFRITQGTEMQRRRHRHPDHRRHPANRLTHRAEGASTTRMARARPSGPASTEDHRIPAEVP